jgi:hypothetical protein
MSCNVVYKLTQLQEFKDILNQPFGKVDQNIFKNINVVATDNISQTSFDFSENLTIDNTYPSIPAYF